MSTLSSLVLAEEAAHFEHFADAMGGDVGVVGRTRAPDSAFSENILAALRHALDDERVTIDVKGSLMKGTQTMTSDIDIVITTPGRQVSRDDKKMVAEKLRHWPGFHQSHVKLKRLAITCVMMGTEVSVALPQTSVACLLV